MIVAQYIVSVLKEYTTVIFGYQGGNISYIIDAIGESEIAFVATRHEQAAAFAACGYALKNATLGVAVSSSGPGAINMLNGIANAYYDSIPSLFITGNVSTGQEHIKGRRQDAFQEVDIVRMARGITKYAIHIETEEQLVDVLYKAIHCAISGRPGPVLIDIPHNIQRAEVADGASLHNYCGLVDYSSNIPQPVWESLQKKLLLAKRPVFLIGGGVCSSFDKTALRKIANHYHIPLITSLRGINAILWQDANYLGFIGEYGNTLANYALYRADFVLVLGSRLSDRSLIASLADQFLTENVYHIDVDETEFRGRIKREHGIVASASEVLKVLLNGCLNSVADTSVWWQELRKILNIYRNSFPVQSFETFLEELVHYLRPSDDICADVGIHLLAIAQAILPTNGLFLLSGGLGCMGFSVATAVGVAFRSMNRVVCMTGDGGLQMNLQELETIVHNSLNVLIIIFNNHALGMIKNLQDSLFEKRYHGSVEGYSCPNWERIASAFNMCYAKVGNYILDDSAIAILKSNGPSILEIDCVDNSMVENTMQKKKFLIECLQEGGVLCG